MLRIVCLLLLASIAQAKCPFGKAVASEDTWSESVGELSGCPMLSQSAPVALSPDKYSTAAGCSCKSPCGATLTTGLAACDWCRTEDSCGKWDLGGHWDYCTYNPVSEFEKQPVQDKTTQIWDRITDPSVVGKSGPNNGKFDTLKTILTESMITSFDDHMEIMPVGRKKVIHAQGVLCPFELKIAESGYSGLLAPGTVSGIVRMGSAASLDIDFFPGMGIKFLRSSVHSANFVALRATGKGGTLGFFDSKFSNHVAPDAALTALQKFQQASGCISMVGLSDVCTYDQDGQKAAEPEFPFEIIFEPTADAKATNVPKKRTNDELLKDLSEIAAGTELFEVSTYASPADKLNGVKKQLGTVTTSAQCHQSIFGDTQLYFRHQRMEEDFAQKPDWIKDMTGALDFKNSGCKASVGPVSKWQCAAPQLAP